MRTYVRTPVKARSPSTTAAAPLNFSAMGRRVVVWVLAVVAVAALIVAAGAASGVLDEARDAPGRPGGQSGPERAEAFPPSSTNAERKPPSPYALKPTPSEPPVKVEFENEPAAGILFDVDTGEVLWEHDADERRPIASLTKMMTALLIAKRHGPGEDVRITPEALARKVREVLDSAPDAFRPPVPQE